jgi:hypothetical protein
MEDEWSMNGVTMEKKYTMKGAIPDADHRNLKSGLEERK